MSEGGRELQQDFALLTAENRELRGEVALLTGANRELQQDADDAYGLVATLQVGNYRLLKGERAARAARASLRETRVRLTNASLLQRIVWVFTGVNI